MKLLIYLVLLTGLGLTCSGNRDKAARLEYGNSFGMCVGYCYYEAVYYPGSVTYTRKGGGHGGMLPQKTCVSDITKHHWEAILNSIDIDEFLKLPETIGCPDCADGGAEWISITTAEGQTHRVTFEYGNYPEPLKEIMNELTQLKEQSEECDDF